MTKTQHAAVCGAGRMGTAIGSAMLRLGYTVSAVDNNPDNLSHFWHVNRGCPTYGHWADLPGKPDVLISALPYHATKAAAEWCLANGVRYCDLGGSVPTSEEIKGLATKAATVPVMTDLGLAPGWINLIAEELYAQLPGATKVEMMVGGIPETRVEADPLNYMLTWSVDGLLNEYRDDCEILLENEVHIVRGLSMCKNVMVAGLDLEAFCTSGASAHSIPVMRERGVRECVYRTLRWRGHAAWIDFLMRTLDRPTLEKVLQESSRHHKHDMVVMHVVVSRGSTKLTKTHVVRHDHQFTAMQRATAYSIASVADLMAAGEFDTIPYPSYADVPITEFNKNLTLLMDGDV